MANPNNSPFCSANEEPNDRRQVILGGGPIEPDSSTHVAMLQEKLVATQQHLAALQAKQLSAVPATVDPQPNQWRVPLGFLKGIEDQCDWVCDCEAVEEVILILERDGYLRLAEPNKGNE